MLHLDPNAGRPFYRQIYEQIKLAILSGALPGGARLTSTRALARDLQAGRNTVENAYAQLALEGYVTAVPGSGYVVTALRRDDRPGMPDVDDNDEGAYRGKAPARPLYNFAYGALDSRDFPRKIWRNLTEDVLLQAEEIHYPPLLPRDEIQGDRELRRELARHLYLRRGVNCTAEQVVMTNGLQPALASLLRVFPSQWRDVAMENPGYSRAGIVFRNNGLRLAPIPVREEGLDVEALAASPARAVFVTPSRQYPTGRVMPIQKRMALLQWAEERRGLIIEDDYDSEYRYKGKPVPSLQSIDRQGRVVYLGSFSKTLSPGLRMGCMVLPDRLLDAYRYAFAGCKCPVSRLEQKILARFTAEGHMERHIRKMCLLNKKKHDTLVEALTLAFSDSLRLHGQNAGLHLLLEFPGRASETELVEKAAEQGVKVYPGSPLWLEGAQKPPTTILLGYGAMPENRMAGAVALLRKAWGRKVK